MTLQMPFCRGDRCPLETPAKQLCFTRWIQCLRVWRRCGKERFLSLSREAKEKTAPCRKDRCSSESPSRQPFLARLFKHENTRIPSASLGLVFVSNPIRVQIDPCKEGLSSLVRLFKYPRSMRSFTPRSTSGHCISSGFALPRMEIQRQTLLFKRLPSFSVRDRRCSCLAQLVAQEGKDPVIRVGAEVFLSEGGDNTHHTPLKSKPMITC